MNSNSLNWVSYCSSIAHFQPFGEFGAACFAHILLKFGCFQPNVQADNWGLGPTIRQLVISKTRVQFFSAKLYPKKKEIIKSKNIISLPFEKVKNFCLVPRKKKISLPPLTNKSYWSIPSAKDCNPCHVPPNNPHRSLLHQSTLQIHPRSNF
jgi:hypothetical protein